MYSPKVMDHFRHPRNMGIIKRADARAQIGNPVCGDVMKIYLMVTRGKEWGDHIIKDIKFQTLGCAAAVATTSMLTELVKGRSFKEAETVTRNSVAEALGGLPPLKMHCSNLATDVLKKAMQAYK